MARTQLTSVERSGHWTVRLTWPNGSIHYFGRYADRREADKWIAEHRWMTAERIEERDIPTVGAKWRPRKRVLTPPLQSAGNRASSKSKKSETERVPFRLT